jgi:drug/metabolite transporter (DMT)-like permease
LDHPTIPTPGSRRPPTAILLAVAILILYVVWGSTYLGIAVAVETIPPFLMAALRFAIAGVVLMLASAAVDRRGFAWPSRREWRDSLIVGALLLAGGNGLVALGEETVPSGIAALMIALMPAWVAVFGRWFFGERLPWAAIVGIAIGLVGVAILVAPTGDGGTFDPLGLLFLALSPVCWSLGSLFSQHRASLPKRPLAATGAQMLTGSIVLAGLSVVTGEPARFDPGAISSESLVALGYLIVFGSLVAYTAYVWLLRNAPLPLIATYAYVNPVVAVFLGTWILQEPLTPRTLVAGAVIVFAVALIITARSRMTGPARPRATAPEPDAAAGRATSRAAT